MTLATLLRASITLAAGAVLAGAVLDLPRTSAGLTGPVGEHLNVSGVTHPVTAVLLNFRAYDTWLEVGVLLLAILGVLALRHTRDLRTVPPMSEPSPVLVWFARVLTPVAIVAAGYLLWLGTHRPGGAFQAGAVLAAMLVLLRLAGFRSVAGAHGGLLRLGMLVGFLAFLLVALWLVVAGQRLLEYPVDMAGALILLIETSITVSTALILAALFAGSEPDPARDPPGASGDSASDSDRQ